jgi:multicomponent Na+:H+ antiporter subunit E
MLAALPRFLGLLAVWVVIGGADLTDLAVGIPTAAVATWFSLRLLPAGLFQLRPAAVAVLLLRFPFQALLAGLDVARRAFDLWLRPGFVPYVPLLGASPQRDAFLTWSSLQPGSLPAGEDRTGAVLVHTLDVTQPVAEAMATEEARFARAVGG